MANHLKVYVGESTNPATAIANANALVAAAIAAAAPQDVSPISCSCSVNAHSDGSAPLYSVMVSLQFVG